MGISQSLASGVPALRTPAPDKGAFRGRLIVTVKMSDLFAAPATFASVDPRAFTHNVAKRQTLDASRWKVGRPDPSIN